MTLRRPKNEFGLLDSSAVLNIRSNTVANERRADARSALRVECQFTSSDVVRTVVNVELASRSKQPLDASFLFKRLGIEDHDLTVGLF